MRAYARSVVIAVAVTGIICYEVATQTQPSAWLFTLACAALVAMTIVADGWREVARRRQARYETGQAEARWQARYQAEHPARRWPEAEHPPGPPRLPVSRVIVMRPDGQRPDQ